MFATHILKSRATDALVYIEILHYLRVQNKAESSCDSGNEKSYMALVMVVSTI